MEIIFEIIAELIVELFVEGSVEAFQNKNIPKPIRNLILTIIFLFYVSVIAFLLIVGISLLKENILCGVILIGIAAVMIIVAVVKLRRKYMCKKTGE